MKVDMSKINVPEKEGMCHSHSGSLERDYTGIVSSICVQSEVRS
jgi:hypothetical protein